MSSISSINSKSGTSNDFADVNDRYTRQLLHGRHPRSFPRQSELWQHYKSSEARLERIVKGHDLWNVIQDDATNSEKTMLTGQQTESVLEGRLKAMASMNSATKTHTGVLHGVTVDLKSKVRLHFTMPVVIVNNLGQYLCINESGEIQCKPQQLLVKKDKIAFKLLDLSDPLNPGPVKYGSPLWLQVINPDNDDLNWQTSSVLAVKLFGPPEMKSMQLQKVRRAHDDHGHRENKKLTSDERRSRRDGDGHSSLSSTMTGGTSRPGSPISATDMMSTGTTGRFGRLNGSSGSPPTMTSDKNIGAVAGTGVGGGAAMATMKPIRKKAFEEAQICGGVKTVKIAAGKHETSDTSIRFLKSKQSTQLGQFVTRYASRAADEEDPEYLNSRVAVLLEQDLYCLATSHGSGYRPWPRNVASVQPVNVSTLTSTDRDRLRSSSDSKLGGLGEDNQLADGSDYACLRRVVMRGLPYEHIADRRCVWHFFVVDSTGNFSSMSVKELRAQKLLKKAREVLDVSRANRTGARKYKELNANGEPLAGGEKFPQMIRQVINHMAFANETEKLEERRKKEKRISRHFRKLYKAQEALINDEETTNEDDLNSEDEDDCSACTDTKPGSSAGTSHAMSESKGLAVSFADAAMVARVVSHVTKDAKEGANKHDFLSTTSSSFLNHHSSGTAGSTSHPGAPLSRQHSGSAGALHDHPQGTGGYHERHSNSFGHEKSQGLRRSLHGAPSSHTHLRHLKHSSHSHTQRHLLRNSLSHREGSLLDVKPAEVKKSEGDILLGTHALFADGRQHARTLLTTSRQASNRTQDQNSLNPQVSKRLKELLDMDESIQQALRYRSRVHQFRHISNVIFDNDVPPGTASQLLGGDEEELYR